MPYISEMIILNTQTLIIFLRKRKHKSLPVLTAQPASLDRRGLIKPGHSAKAQQRVCTSSAVKACAGFGPISPFSLITGKILHLETMLEINLIGIFFSLGHFPLGNRDEVLPLQNILKPFSVPIQNHPPQSFPGYQ